MLLASTSNPGENSNHSSLVLWTLQVVHGFISLIVQFPFEAQFIHCPRMGESVSSPSVISLTTAGCHIGDGVSIITVSPSLLPFSLWSLYQCCAEAVKVLPALSSSEGIALYVGVNSVCLWEEVKYRIFLYCLLTSFLSSPLFKRHHSTDSQILCKARLLQCVLKSLLSVHIQYIISSIFF